MYKKRQLSYGYPMVILWVSYGMIPILALLKVNEGRGRKETKGVGWRERKVAEGLGWRERKEIFYKKRQMYLHI